MITEDMPSLGWRTSRKKRKMTKRTKMVAKMERRASMIIATLTAADLTVT
jgi:hypothetical protein